MKKPVVTLLMASFALQGCGTIYVGNVPFSSKDICSSEYADWYRPNSSCLPPARAANVQSYFMEEKRLPISGDEARQVDRAAQTEDAAYALSPLQQAVNASTALRVSIARLTNSIKASEKAISSAQADEGMVNYKSAMQKLSDDLSRTDFKSATGEFDGITDDLKKVALASDDFTKIRESLKKARDQLANLSDASTVNVAKEAVTAGIDKIARYAAPLKTLEDGAQRVKKWRDSTNRYITPVEISNIKDSYENLQKERLSLETRSTESKNTTNKQEFEKQMSKLDAVIVAVEAVLINAKATAGYLDDAAAKFSSSNTSMNEAVTTLRKVTQPTDRLSSASYLDQALVLVSELQLGAFKSTATSNLLPSLIGRVFIADINHSTTVVDGEYLMPGNGGNLEFLPVLNLTRIEDIQTEVQVNSDISGIVRKQVGMSANFDASQLLGKITTPKIPLQLKAVMQASLASLDTGSGSYYYVTMTAKQLDELNGKLWEFSCKAHVPPGRGDARQNGKTPYPINNKGNDACNKGLLGSELGFDEDSRSLSNAPGLGVIVGVAILRTRKGTSEVCSTMEITLSPDRSKLDTGKGSVCSELRAILEGSSVSQAEISAALATVNAAYRSETYKTLLIHDHASVLAIHWVPIKL